MYKFKMFIFMAFVVMLSACGSEESTSTTATSDDNVFKGQVDALEKAKGVEDTIQSSFEQNMKQPN